MDSELLNLDNLSEEEKLTILKVIKRDEDLRWTKNQQVNHLKNDIHNIRVKSILHDGDDLTKICARCHEPLGFFFNTGEICPQCRFKVCKKCREINLSGAWSCSLCFKQNQLKLLRGDWVKKIGSKKRGKFEHGGDIVKASIRRSLSEGSLLADDDGSPSLARAAGSHCGSMDRAGYPQDADKKRLHQLFESFRSNTTDSDSNASVKHVSCRRRRDSGSSSTSEEGEKGDKTNLYKSVCDSLTSSEPGLIPSRATSETESALNSPVARPSRHNSKPIETTVPPELTNGNSRNLGNKGKSSDTVSQSSSSENARFSSTESGQNAKRRESKISQQTNPMSNLRPPSASPRQNVRLSPEHSNVHLRKGSGQSDTSSISSARTASPATKMRLLDLASTRALERDGSDGSDNDDSLRTRKNKKHSISAGSRDSQTVLQYEEGSQYYLESHNLDTAALETTCLDMTGSDSFFSLKLDVGSNLDTKICMLNFTTGACLLSHTDGSTCTLKHNNNITNETYCLSQSSSNSDTLDSLHDAPSPYCLTSSALQHINTLSAQYSDLESIEDTCTHHSIAESLSNEVFYTPEAYPNTVNKTINTNTNQIDRSSISDLIEDSSREFQESQQLTSSNKTFIIDREDIKDSFNIADAVTEEEEPDQKCSKYVLDIKEYVTVDDDDVDEYDNSDSESKERQFGETFIYGEADQLLTDLQNDSEVSFLTSPHIDFNTIHKPVPKHAYPITDTDEVSDNLSVISEATEPDNSSLSDLASNYQDEDDDIDELANKSIDVLFDEQYDLPIAKSRSPRLKKKFNKTPPTTHKHVSFSKETIFKQETDLQSGVPKNSDSPIVANDKEITPEKEQEKNETIDAALVKDEVGKLNESITKTHIQSSNIIPQETSLSADLNRITNSSEVKLPIVVVSDKVPNIRVTKNLEQPLPVIKEPPETCIGKNITVTIPDPQRNKPISSGTKYSKYGSKLKVQKFMKKVKKNSPRSSPVEELESDSNSTCSTVDLIRSTESTLREQKSPLPKRRKQNTKTNIPVPTERIKSDQIVQESKKSLRSGFKDLKEKPTLPNIEKETESCSIQSSSLKISSFNQGQNLVSHQDFLSKDISFGPDSCPKHCYKQCEVHLQGSVEKAEWRKTIELNEIKQTESTKPMKLSKDWKKPPRINYQYSKEELNLESDSRNETHQEIFSSTIDKLKWKSNMESVNNDCDKHSKRELCDVNYVNLTSRDLNSHQNLGKTVNDTLIIINQADEVKIPRTIQCHDDAKKSQNNELKNCDETHSNSVSISSVINNQTVPNDLKINTKTCDKWKEIEIRHSKTDVSSCESVSMEVTGSESCGDHLELEIQRNAVDTRENREKENIYSEDRIKTKTTNTDKSTNFHVLDVQHGKDYIPNEKNSEVSSPKCPQTLENLKRNTEDSKCEKFEDVIHDNTVTEKNDLSLLVDMTGLHSQKCHMPNTEFIENQDLESDEVDSSRDHQYNFQKDVNNKNNPQLSYINSSLAHSIEENKESELCEVLPLTNVGKREQVSDPGGSEIEIIPMSDVLGDRIKNDHGTSQTQLKDLEMVKQNCEIVASSESTHQEKDLFLENNIVSKEEKLHLKNCDVNDPLNLISQSDSVKSAGTSLESQSGLVHKSINPLVSDCVVERDALKQTINSDTESRHLAIDNSKHITTQYSSGEESTKDIDSYSKNSGYCVIDESPSSTETNLHFTNPNINSGVAMDTNILLPKVKEGPDNASKQDQTHPSSPTTRESPNMDNSSKQLTQTIPDIQIVSSSSSPKDTETDSIKLTVTNEGSDETGSHGDSGHISGNNSLENTPEHRASRQSHLSVPSLQLSTTSNDNMVNDSIEEEDENIDYLVASHRSMGSARSINSRGLSSLFSGSRESILSIYSDAGEINYGKIPVSGEVLLSIDYNYKTGALEIYVKQCKDLAPVDTKRKRSDPYIKTYLLPDKTRSGKRKTKIKKHTLNPVFDEVLRYTLSQSEVENRILWIAVWNNDRFGHNDFLGEVTLSLDTYKFGDSSPKWYPLQERFEEPQLGSLMPYKGDLIISLRYITPDLLAKESAKKSKVKKSKSGKGALHVMVKEARNLTALRSNGTSDPFCKGYLLPDKHKSGKQKTPTIKKNCNPVWNYLLVFEDLDREELSERSLELTIWDHDTISSNDFLGGIRFNLGTGICENKAVEWMDGRGEEIAIWQCMIDRPNTWIDACVNLRATMGKSLPKKVAN